MPDAEHSKNFEALKTLYDGQAGTLKTLSERSFTVTLQTLTLNLAVVAGLIGTEANLSERGQQIGTALLVVFGILVVSYLVSKSCTHHSEKKKLIPIQSSIAEVAGVGEHFPNKPPSFIKSFLSGSLIFILCVVLSTAMSVTALWVPLVAHENQSPDKTVFRVDAAQ